MTIYEVTATVDPDRCEDYETYMRKQHVSDVLATGLFLDETFETAGSGRYRVRYTLPSRESLEEYLEVHAPRLRADFHAHFSTGVELSREDWDVLQRFA
jgi:hypothetical protein